MTPNFIKGLELDQISYADAVRLNNLPYSDIRGMKRHTDIQEVALLCYCDRMGRTNSDKNKEEANLRLFLEKCK